MSENTYLSLSARLFCYLGPLSTIALTAFASPKTALLSPLAFVHTGYLYKKWYDANRAEPSRRGKLEPMVWTFATAGTLGLEAMAVIQAAVGYAICTLIFGNGETRSYFLEEVGRSSIAGLTDDELAHRAELAWSWKNWILYGLTCFGLAGFLEEALKYSPIAWARRRRLKDDSKLRNRAYLDYALSSALSFGLVEGIGFLYASCVHGEENGSKLALTIFERLMLGSSGHLLMAALTALRAIRRDYYGEKYMSWWSVVGPSIVLHGAYDFGAMIFSASEGHVGWIHPTSTRKTIMMLLMAFGFLFTEMMLVRRELRILKDRDRQQQ
ncbi:hypothetical protein LTR37_004642 [Vermiconidia calcicola]|uniref:Uncharacterized protein n=1 Tax=Vermiconidia calcicola TaxID=1690605 RepID=A0ACC3NLT6_9PEZI|nr:hypothetical protein LTR37_004642 [Vermiconidia calcicola]